MAHNRKRRRQSAYSSEGYLAQTRSYQTRIAVYEGIDRSVGDAALSAYAALYGKVQHKLFADIAAGRVRLCFGSKKLWRKQYDLKANGYASREAWLEEWRDVRSDEFFVLGSRDETAGCQLCVATVADDGTVTLRLRMPDGLAGLHGKYLVVPNVRFASGHDVVLSALGSNTEYAVYRRQHGEQAARATELGQAPSATASSVMRKGGGYSPPRNCRSWR